MRDVAALVGCPDTPARVEEVGRGGGGSGPLQNGHANPMHAIFLLVAQSFKGDATRPFSSSFGWRNPRRLHAQLSFRNVDKCRRLQIAFH